MASPTFNSQTIFDSKRTGGARFSEGVLWAQGYTAIWQRLHFNGEDGDRYLAHGKSDRQWVFSGILSAPTITELQGLFSAIQTYIDEAEDDPTMYRTLVDSFGASYAHAQVRTFNALDIHVSKDGYIAQVQVTGIIQGMEHEDAGGS